MKVLGIVVSCLALLLLLLLLNRKGVERSEVDIDEMIIAAANKEGISPCLLKAVVWKESRMDPHRIGKKGEIGLMQLMPGAVTDWSTANKRPAPTKEDLKDPQTNLEIGAWYLAWTGRLWPGREDAEVLRLAAYNAGCGKVEKLWLPKDVTQKVTLDSITYPGTRDYIVQILAKKQEYEQAGFGKSAEK